MKSSILSPQKLKAHLYTVGLGLACWAFPNKSFAVNLSIEEALQQGEVQNPLVRRAMSELKIAAAKRVSAALPLTSNPVLGGYLGSRKDVSGSFPLATGFEWGLRLEQTFEITGQRNARLAEVARTLDVARAREKLARIETRARIRSSYMGALIAGAHVRAAREEEAMGVKLYESATLRVKSGAASEVELHLAEVERGRLAHSRMEAELAEHTALADLERTIGFDPQIPLTLTTTLTKPEIPKTEPKTLFKEALARRLELRIVAAGQAQLDATIIKLSREALPSPAIFIDLQRQQPGQTYFGGGVNLSLPIWQRNQGPTAIAQAEQQLLETERIGLEQKIAIDLSELQRIAHMRQEAVELWESQIVPAAVANVELVTQGWRAGKFDLFRVIQVAQQATEARRKQLEVLGQLWQTIIELDRARGAL